MRFVSTAFVMMTIALMLLALMLLGPANAKSHDILSELNVGVSLTARSTSPSLIGNGRVSLVRKMRGGSGDRRVTVIAMSTRQNHNNPAKRFPFLSGPCEPISFSE